MFIAPRIGLSSISTDLAVSSHRSYSTSIPRIVATTARSIEEFQHGIDDLGDFEVKIVCGLAGSESSLTSYGDFLGAFLRGEEFTEHSVRYALSLAQELDAMFPDHGLNHFVAAQAARVTALNEHCPSGLRISRDEAVVNLLASLIGLVSALMDLGNKLDGTDVDLSELDRLWFQKVAILLPQRTSGDHFSPPIEHDCDPPSIGHPRTSRE